MNSMLVGYRLNVEQFISTKKNFIDFLNYYYHFFECLELKITPKVLNSNYFEFIILQYLKCQSYVGNFHIRKNYIYDYNTGLSEERLFSLLKNSKSNIVTHLNDGPVNSDLFKNLISISSSISDSNNLLLENPVISTDLFEYLYNCEKLSKMLNVNCIQNIGFCLDFGHLTQSLVNQDISFNSFYTYLLEQKNYLLRLKEFHLHDYRNKCDHQVFYHDNVNLMNFKLLYKLAPFNTIILENNIGDDVENAGVKQIKLVKRMLLDENQANK